MKKVYGDRKGVEKEIVLQIVKRFRKKYTITAILNALGVARSTYYRWCTAGITLLTVHEKAIIKLCQSTKRSEEHTSELQSRGHLVCRLLLEKKKRLNKTVYLRI